MRLKDIGEIGFIKRIESGCLVRDKKVIRGIGDDCCVFKASGRMAILLTTDMLVEKIHFLLGSISPYELGRKSLAVNLSDIAAMGGTPREAVISIAIPDTVDLAILDGVYDGMKSMAKEFEVNILGGDTTSSPEHLVINVALVGEAAEDEILYRSGAGEGEVIFLTGPVGSSAAGLDLILKGREIQGWEALIEAHHNPYPHIEAGRIIASTKKANSLIDVSDGVAADLGHICTESGLGAILEERMIPTTETFREYCKRFHEDSNHLSLHVGEDYVLLGTAVAGAANELRAALESEGLEFHQIGQMVAEPGLRFRTRENSLESMETSGWDHFR
ncbi:MAG: thiamine-phosphate kinase [Deltaproteobacteria bacterium]|nr:thiamine-phosphate kinase [Deltaproteobacteria bacterium]